MSLEFRGSCIKVNNGTSKKIGGLLSKATLISCARIHTVKTFQSEIKDIPKLN